ncbi:uncharacterized protein LOC100900662 [Galendromus occidentalis]|uniref:ATP-dependent DNA helicase n=1 Tax=Galendromus occidentalis TaxID=34638 RepID=A0AAJ7SE27_9ACAR|nr:uncharacterized protein LOC100903404 [Galendromus occidentalis]XP_028966688.1 uncharacterized protein LOC100907913 [Galendromus occidentalis]XP_028966804.1 uncharacterized protein LOC100905361 [Galendromus occidentalis]XP_028967775.1 uncharacterized protein LOC100897748 [Galendromus occidentalis]XP_028968238.1 uncharacterized protein LOC100900662 [Galendromus occidentalis]
MFLDNEFGHKCDVCDRIWFKRDLKAVDSVIANFLIPYFPDENVHSFRLCHNCYKVSRGRKIPNLSKVNGYRYPPKPVNLPKLDPVSERLISPRIPYMQIRRLRHEGSYGIIGQVINVPVDVDTMVRCLPRSLDDDYAFNVNLKKNIVHKSSYISGFVKKSTIHEWLKYLVQQPLYKHYNITIDWSVFNESATSSGNDGQCEDQIERLDACTVPEAELIHSRQHTMMWNEEHSLNIAPGQHRRPESLTLDTLAEEMSFPAIYLGCGRHIRSITGERIRATAYSMCMSEIRRSDRRGVIPQHVLYMAMKILRLRVRDGVQNMYRCMRPTEMITRSMIEDREFVERLIETNQAFLRTIPNSVQYWSYRKKDLFAMIRQLGKPTAFLTLSASETKWPHLLRNLYRLSDEYKSLGEDIGVEEILEKLDRYKRAFLVAEDPVACAMYFDKLVHVLMSMLSAKKAYNPFGRYRVLDYFLRIEFQARGSPHAHILLWLNDDPKEDISEEMPRTLQMITDLCSVDESDLSTPDMIRNQTHAHTFTCTKRGEQSCRFEIPYWPIHRTRVLLPLSRDDGRRKTLKIKVADARKKLESKTYDTIEAFMMDINCDGVTYLELIRSSLKRPTILFKRNMSQIFINTFHPWIASALNSNMDLQIILDPYSCASYVVEYVNKSNRGFSHLHRELMKIHETNPEFDQCQLMTKVGLKILNSVEMTAQEAAWYLLRQPMSWASRGTVSIPTMRPHERYRARKRKSVMDAQNLSSDSTDIWTKNIIQKYEERAPSLEALTLAQFAACFEHHPFEETNDVDGSNYRKRATRKVIRYRNYDVSDTENYKREMVTLHIPFRNELIDVIDRDKFLEVYDGNKELIMERRKEFEANIDIEALLKEIEALCSMNEEISTTEETEGMDNVTTQGFQPNDDDFDDHHLQNSISAVRPRENVLSKNDYCVWMRKLNAEQRELILEVIHRLHDPNSEAIQIFLTGPAGCGKTYTLKALMETYNRYAQEHNNMNNAYISTATTGKAATALNGVTVHSAFKLALSNRAHQLSNDVLQTYRHHLRNVRCIIIDEISMCSSHVFHGVNTRLQAMTGEFDANFGGLDLFACGDLKQLPPVRAAPVFTATKSSIGGKAILWQSLNYFPLVQVVRQSDIGFSTLLTKIGCGEALSQAETDKIQSRFRTRRWCDANLSTEVMRLYHTSADVQSYNDSAIPVTESTHNHIATDIYTGYRTEAERRNAIGKMHRKDTRDTGNLPYTITLAEGYPYMLTVNVDVEDGLVNGAIGQLRHVEHYALDKDGQDHRRLWLSFENDHIGRKLRLKYKAHVRSKPNDLSEQWVPIESRSANIKIDSKIRCRRLQFPLVSACALTIHKSQGGTFNRIVYDYHKNHQQQLVYVALSRVTSLEGLYITNNADDFTFYHTGTANSPSIREVQNEYKRLATHRLRTITTDIDDFLTTASPGVETWTIVNVNVQSLHAHAEDIATDPLLQRADLLVTTETWMHPSSTPINIDGYHLDQQSTCGKRSGGVAIYRKVGTALNTGTPRATFSNDSLEHTGDIAITHVHLNGKIEFILAAVYMHQGNGYDQMEEFLSQTLGEYDRQSARRQMPMLVIGDFNTSNDNRKKLEVFLETHHGLKMINNEAEKTTLGGTCIDLTFARNLPISCRAYVSYFSYHRPVFNKIQYKPQ